MIRFTTQVKLFVLDERSEGKGWKSIKERITQKFNIKPPTTRAMQKWEKNLNREKLNAELINDVKSEYPLITAETRIKFAQELLPTLWRAKDVGADIELAGWKWFLHFIDERLGPNRFQTMVDQYMAERPKNPAVTGEETKK